MDVNGPAPITLNAAVLVSSQTPLAPRLERLRLSVPRWSQAKLKPSKVFSNAVDPPLPQSRKSAVNYITGLCFDDRGETLVTAGDDESFRVYSTKTGKCVRILQPSMQFLTSIDRFVKTFHSKKYGVDLPRFTHKNTTIIHASTKEDDTIRYHSLHDNKYLQYFRGHKKRYVVRKGV